MSLKNIQLSSIQNHRLNNQSITSINNYIKDDGDWTKPINWMDLPNISGGPQKFVGLIRIDPTGNFLAFNVANTVVQGNYLVDWGDSVSEYVASNTPAYHEYNYNTISSSGESVLGYRQAIVTVTPSGSAVIGTINLNINHNRASLNTSRANKWLDIAINCSGATSLNIGGNNSPKRYCERVRIFDHNTTNASAICSNMLQLQSFSMVKTSGITDWSNAFFSTKFITAPNLDTISATRMDYMFSTCRVLRNIPLYDTSKVTNFDQTFRSCTALERIPHFDTRSAINMNGMFWDCSTLGEVPLLNTINVTLMIQMFMGCSLLRSVPCFNTSKVTRMDSMFHTCPSLESLPSFDMSSNTSLSLFAFNCSRLRKIPSFNTKNVTNFGNAFNNCALTEWPQLDLSAATDLGAFMVNMKAKTLPNINTSKVTIMANFLAGWTNIETIPYIETSGVTNCSNMFNSCIRLSGIPLLNTSNSTNMSSMFFNCFNLKTIPSLNTSKSTVTNNMFYNCYNLANIPYIETSGVTDTRAMFYNCANLKEIPNLNLSRSTTIQEMFYGCSRLEQLPSIDTSKVTNMTDTFVGCNALISIPHLNATGVTVANNIFNGCSNLSSGSLSGITITHSIANCNFSGPALNTYYTNLGNGNSRTLTVTGNYGVTEDTPSIATAKGWTITG